MGIKEYVKAHRKQLGYSQERMAKEFGVSKNQYIRYEKGEMFPTTQKLRAYCTKFDLSADEVLFGKSSPSLKDNDFGFEFNLSALNDDFKDIISQMINMFQNMPIARTGSIGLTGIESKSSYQTQISTLKHFMDLKTGDDREYTVAFSAVD